MAQNINGLTFPVPSPVPNGAGANAQRLQQQPRRKLNPDSCVSCRKSHKKCVRPAPGKRCQGCEKANRECVSDGVDNRTNLTNSVVLLSAIDNFNSIVCDYATLFQFLAGPDSVRLQAEQIMVILSGTTPSVLATILGASYGAERATEHDVAATLGISKLPAIERTKLVKKRQSARNLSSTGWEHITKLHTVLVNMVSGNVTDEERATIAWWVKGKPLGEDFVALLPRLTDPVTVGDGLFTVPDEYREKLGMEKACTGGTISPPQEQEQAVQAPAPPPPAPAAPIMAAAAAPIIAANPFAASSPGFVNPASLNLDLSAEQAVFSPVVPASAPGIIDSMDWEPLDDTLQYADEFSLPAPAPALVPEFFNPVDLFLELPLEQAVPAPAAAQEPSVEKIGEDLVNAYNDLIRQDSLTESLFSIGSNPTVEPSPKGSSTRTSTRPPTRPSTSSSPWIVTAPQ